MALYTYICNLAHTTEAIRPLDTSLIPCEVCQRVATRVRVNRGVSIVAPTVDTRGMFRRYQEATAELNMAASSIEADTGGVVRTPNYWKLAKRRAAAMAAANESPVVPKERFRSTDGLPAPPS